MDPIIWEIETPASASRCSSATFAGWNDAAGAATAALTAAAESLDAEVIAQIDPEEFFDFQANRPTDRADRGRTREIEWPGNVFIAGRSPRAERDLMLISGTEPTPAGAPSATRSLMSPSAAGSSRWSPSAR